jgi:hypothetical protein
MAVRSPEKPEEGGWILVYAPESIAEGTDRFWIVSLFP